MRRLVLSAALAFAIVAMGNGQQLPPAFRSGVDLVTVDFLAFDSAGRPRANLAQADVSLKVDGRARPIQSMQWIQVADPVSGGGVRPETIPPPFASNAMGDAGRAVVIVLDDESLRTGREAPLRRAVNRFLSLLSPRDRVALVTMPYGGVKVDFTSEHGKVPARTCRRLRDRPRRARTMARRRHAGQRRTLAARQPRDACTSQHLPSSSPRRSTAPH